MWAASMMWPPFRYKKDVQMIEVRAYAGLIRNHVELAGELGIEIAGLARDERERALIAAAYGRWGE